MKIKELLSKLSAFDPERDVLCCCEDENLLPEGHCLRLFDIDYVGETEAEKVRGEDNIPSFKLGKSEYSSPHVLINIMSEF